MSNLAHASSENGYELKKIMTVYVIDRTTHRATEEVQTPWVFEGEGVATIKHDGSSVMIRDGQAFKRFDAKHGKTPPSDFEPAQPQPDALSGHWPGWVPIREDNPADRWHIEAFSPDLPDGTYELVGPKVQRNPYGLDRHELWRHGREVVEVERTREGIVGWLTETHHEGLVFHHPDGRMAKVRRKDFGIKW